MRLAKRSVVSVLSPILIISLSLAGCGPTNGLPPLTGEFLYISNGGDNTISEFSIDTATGLLTNVGSFNSTAGNLFYMAVHPTNEFIYAADTFNFVLGFDIGDQGFSGLIFLRNSHVKANAPTDVAITPNGKFLYASSSPKISEYSIDQSSGALKSIGSVSTGGSPFGLTVDSTGNYAYVAASSGSASEYVVQPAGTLAANGTLVLPSGSSPLLIATNPTVAAPATECAYATDNNGLFGLQEMAIDTTTGTLTYLGSVPAANRVVGIAVHPNGNFIYATNPDSDMVSVFTPVSNDEPTCTVALTSQVSEPINSAPDGIAVEPMGRWAYVANFNFGKVGEFSIDGITGALTFLGQVDSESPPNPSSAPRGAVTTH